MSLFTQEQINKFNSLPLEEQVQKISQIIHYLVEQDKEFFSQNEEIKQNINLKVWEKQKHEVLAQIFQDFTFNTKDMNFEQYTNLVKNLDKAVNSMSNGYYGMSKTTLDNFKTQIMNDEVGSTILHNKLKELISQQANLGKYNAVNQGYFFKYFEPVQKFENERIPFTAFEKLAQKVSKSEKQSDYYQELIRYFFVQQKNSKGFTTNPFLASMIENTFAKGKKGESLVEAFIQETNRIGANLDENRASLILLNYLFEEYDYNKQREFKEINSNSYKEIINNVANISNFEDLFYLSFVSYQEVPFSFRDNAKDFPKNQETNPELVKKALDDTKYGFLDNIQRRMASNSFKDPVSSLLKEKTYEIVSNHLSDLGEDKIKNLNSLRNFTSKIIPLSYEDAIQNTTLIGLMKEYISLIKENIEYTNPLVQYSRNNYLQGILADKDEKKEISNFSLFESFSRYASDTLYKLGNCNYIQGEKQDNPYHADLISFYNVATQQTIKNLLMEDKKSFDKILDLHKTYIEDQDSVMEKIHNNSVISEDQLDFIAYGLNHDFYQNIQHYITSNETIDYIKNLEVNPTEKGNEIVEQFNLLNKNLELTLSIERKAYTMARSYIDYKSKISDQYKEELAKELDKEIKQRQKEFKKHKENVLNGIAKVI